MVFYPKLESEIYGDSWISTMLEQYDKRTIFSSGWDSLSPVQRKAFIRECSIHCFTTWFRDSAALTLFKCKVAPVLMKELKRPIRIAFVGCSSGVELWSTMFFLWKNRSRFRFSGFDVSREIIAEAQKAIFQAPDDGRWYCEGPDGRHFTGFNEFGLYRASKEGVVPYKDKRKNGVVRWYITPSEEAWKYAEFAQADILEGSLPGSTYDVIFCQNLLCHFADYGKRLTLRNILRSLSSTGWLVFGNPYMYSGKREQEYCHFLSNLEDFGLSKFDVSFGKWGWIDFSNTRIYRNSSG